MFRIADNVAYYLQYSAPDTKYVLQSIDLMKIGSESETAETLRKYYLVALGPHNAQFSFPQLNDMFVSVSGHQLIFTILGTIATKPRIYSFELDQSEGGLSQANSSEFIEIIPNLPTSLSSRSYRGMQQLYEHNSRFGLFVVEYWSVSEGDDPSQTEHRFESQEPTSRKGKYYTVHLAIINKENANSWKVDATSSIPVKYPRPDRLPSVPIPSTNRHLLPTPTVKFIPKGTQPTSASFTYAIVMLNFKDAFFYYVHQKSFTRVTSIKDGCMSLAAGEFFLQDHNSSSTSSFYIAANKTSHKSLTHKLEVYALHFN